MLNYRVDPLPCGRCPLFHKPTCKYKDVLPIANACDTGYRLVARDPAEWVLGPNGWLDAVLAPTTGRA